MHPPLVALFAAAAAAAAPELPSSVQAAVKSVADQCREVGGTPKTDKALASADLNADGAPDFILDVGGAICDGAWSVYGDREKAVTVFLADGKGGAAQAFEDWTFGSKLEGGKLWLTVAGEKCGKKPAANFASENFCERPLAWTAKTKKLDYAPVSAAKMIE